MVLLLVEMMFEKHFCCVIFVNSPLVLVAIGNNLLPKGKAEFLRMMVWMMTDEGFWGMPTMIICILCVTLLIYILKFILQTKNEMKRAYHLGYKLLSGIENDFILKIFIYIYIYIFIFRNRLSLKKLPEWRIYWPYSIRKGIAKAIH